MNMREEATMLTRTITRLDVPGPKARAILERDRREREHFHAVSRFDGLLIHVLG